MLPLKVRRPSRTVRPVLPQRRPNILFQCLRYGQNGLLGVFLLLVLINILFFYGESPTRERSKGEFEAFTPMWTSELREPVDDLTCEDWLTREDEVKDERNFAELPVRVLSRNDKVHGGCGVGCVWEKHVADGNCDADTTGEDPKCLYEVVTLKSPEDALPEGNNSKVVTMGLRLDSDIPIGHPTWTDYHFMNPVGAKTAPASAVALVNDKCQVLEQRYNVIREFWKEGFKMDVFGKCLYNRSALSRPQEMIARYKFALIFEDYAEVGYMSPDYWMSLAGGTIPIIVSTFANNLKFLPADNACLKVAKMDDVKKTVKWASYLLRVEEAYTEMLRWKDDWPADAFLALLDMPVVRSECRLCIHVATRIAGAMESQQHRPCRCFEKERNQTVYHIFVRERGRFKFLPLFLRSSELTVMTLVKSVYRLFKAKRHKPIWADYRPESLSGAVYLRAFRIYPVSANQDMVLQGHGAFRTDDQLQRYTEATPCPRLEVIFL